MADDAGALLVRSGLVSANALEDARARVASLGGTLGEQLVTSGAITDDDLTDFYCTRLLVPQVNPNALARLTSKIVAAIPSDMAIELRAIPVSFDADNNLTVAMSDPSDRHAVDEIAFFTGVYVVRAVATQMQIAWCLAHYYGHVTALGQRLLRSSEPRPAAPAPAQRPPRTKGLTGKVNATRHRAVAPVTGPVNVLRPNSGELDLRPLDHGAAAALGASAGASVGASVAASVSASVSASASASVSASAGAPSTLPAVARSGAPATPRSSPASTPSPPAPAATAVGSSPAPTTPRAAPVSTPTSAPTIPRVPAAALPSPAGSMPTPASAPTLPGVGPVAPAAAAVGPPAQSAPSTSAAPPPAQASVATSLSAIAIGLPAFGTVPRASHDAPTLPPINAPAPPEPEGDAGDDADPSSDGAPDKPRTRSVSGEIRAPIRRAPSIKPPLPEPDDDDDDEPVIVIERGNDDSSGPRKAPVRRRVVKSNPPELRARAGEVDLKSTQDRAIDLDEPRIVIDEDALAPPTARIDTRPTPRDTPPPLATIDVVDDPDAGAVIHDRVPERESQPILLDRPRATPDQFDSAQPDDEDADTGEIVVMLDARSQKHRPERRTVVGVPPAPVPVRVVHDPDAVPTALDHPATDRIAEPPDDATRLDVRPAPVGEDTTSDVIAAPPLPASDADTNPHVVAEPPDPAPPAPSPPARLALPAVGGAELDDDDDDDDDEPSGPRTSVMTAAELDDAIPYRTAEVLPGHLAWHRVDHDPIDDGWGPPGTTIPPPLLGAIPGSEDDDDELHVIPMPSIDSSPLMVGPSPLPPPGDTAGLARTLEDATARAIEVIRELERAQSRDQVVEVMIAHLAETHHRAGFFVTRHTVSKGAGELGLFAMTPRPAVMPFATLRLDRPSTLQDVVDTRLPYRGPMHDDASRGFLISVLGACPPEILLVPVAVRERVVGVLFGEHRQRHTFDDQLALAARAAGMALERILKAKRG